MTEGYRRAFRLAGRSREGARNSVDEELALHLELMVEELVAEGWPEAEALGEAERRFGDVERTRSYCTEVQARKGRAEGRSKSMDELRQDVRYALRGVRKAPGYAALVILTLAFGISATTTVLSVMSPYFFRTLPFEDPGSLVHVTQVDPVSGWHMDRFSLPIFEDWNARSGEALEDLAAYSYGGVNVTGPEGPEGVTASPVTGNLFGVLGARAHVGRVLLPEDQGPSAEPVAVLDHAFWQRRYLGDPGVIGRTITLDGVAHTVVGVMPPEFVFPFGGVRLWTAVREAASEADRGATPYLLVGRMRPGWTRERVDEALTQVQTELAAIHPDVDGGWSGVTVLPMRAALNFGWDMMRVAFGVLLGAVLLVLAIACVNVASLTLARAGTRVREVAVRMALGAGRSRVVRQFLTESLVLALAGGGVGILLAVVVTGLVGSLIPEDLYRVGEVGVDGAVLAVSMVVTMGTPLLFGLAPALGATRRPPAEDLKEGSRGSGGMASSRGRRVLVVAQVALAVVLTNGAGLMLRSLGAVQSVALGFEPQRVLTLRAQPPDDRYGQEDVESFARRAIDRLEALPGVSAASATLFIPLNHEVSSLQFSLPEAAAANAEGWPTAVANRAYPGYFEAMGVALLAGRDFTLADDRSAAPVAIVNRTLAERWPEGTALGRTLLVGDPAAAREVTVVGVVADVRHDGLERSPGPQIYRPALQGSVRRLFFVARADGDPSALAGGARSVLADLDPDISVAVRPMEAVVRENLLQWSLGTSFLAVFGGGALLLAALGIYGLIAYSVSRRRRELGVRIALGASAAEIRRQVVGDGLRLAGAGLAVGVAGALTLAHVAAAALYGVAPWDPVTLAGVVVLFLGVAGAASWLPAERASRSDPVQALRAE